MVKCNKMREKIAYYDEFQNYDYIVAEMGVHYYPSDAKIFVYGGDEDYHSDDYNCEIDIWFTEENGETHVYI